MDDKDRCADCGRETPEWPTGWLFNDEPYEAVCPRCRDKRKSARLESFSEPREGPGYWERYETDPEFRERVERQRRINAAKPSAGEVLLRHNRKIEDAVERALKGEPPKAPMVKPSRRRKTQFDRLLDEAQAKANLRREEGEGQ